MIQRCILGVKVISFRKKLDTNYSARATGFSMVLLSVEFYVEGRECEKRRKMS